MNQQERCLWLIRALMEELPQYGDAPIPALPDRRWRLLRSLMNVRPPLPASDEFLRVQDAFLREMTAEKGIVDASALPTGREEQLVLWQGDITRLKCDAIVNAANGQMLGCFSPCHGCIDNMIHTMAGVQLRLACAELMERQGREEPAGQAKITPGFNLPAKPAGKICAPHCGADRGRAADPGARAPAFLLLPLLPFARGGKGLREYRFLLHFHRGFYVPQPAGRGDCDTDRADLAGGNREPDARGVQRVQGPGPGHL